MENAVYFDNNGGKFSDNSIMMHRRSKYVALFLKCNIVYFVFYPEDDLSLYSLWSYYRAFDGVSSLKPEDSQEHFSLKRPSEFSSTLEYTHPHLLSDPGKAIVEETGKVPPVFVNKAFESDDDEEQDTEPVSRICSNTPPHYSHDTVFV